MKCDYDNYSVDFSKESVKLEPERWYFGTNVAICHHHITVSSYTLYNTIFAHMTIVVVLATLRGKYTYTCWPQ